MALRPSVKRLETIVDVAPEAWNAAVERLGGAIHHRHEWLAAYEANDIVDVDARHVALVDAGGDIVALAPCYRTRRCPKLDMFRRHYVEADLDGAMTVVHSMYGQTSEILAPGRDERAWLLDEIEASWSQDGTAALAFPLVPIDDPLLPLLKDRGYRIGLLSCTNLLDVEWPSFEAYLAALPRAKRRNVRRATERSEAEGLMAVWDRDRARLPALAALVAKTAGRHGSPVFFSLSYLEAIVDRLGAAAELVTMSADGRAVLQCLALTDGRELVPWAVGIDYDRLERYDQYNYLYATLVRTAAERRLRRLNLGRSTYLIKRKFGCAQRPVLIAAKARPAAEAGVASWVAAIDARARRELAEVGQAALAPSLAEPVR